MSRLARTLMIQGTASSAGKTVLVAGLCRHFANLGLRVAPFKSQNMALNSAATADGLEIGRAQAMQAAACRVQPSVSMNPILLKPEADHRSQVVVLGRVQGTMEAAEYQRRKPELLGIVNSSLATLRSQYDLVVIEGAGSPAEINLVEHDIANMRVAEMAGAPVLLVADIDRGGVFASLLGTLELLAPARRDRVRGLIINKFRGDLSLLAPGLDFIQGRVAKPVLGVVPWIPDLGLAEEDSASLEGGVASDEPIAVVRLPRLSNFDDFDPLPARYISSPRELQGARAIILPGTKATVADLRWLRQRGLAEAIVGLGLPVIGICGGFQMLGRTIRDPDGVESDEPEVDGLNLLPVETIFAGEKETTQVEATTVAGGHSLRAYQIHMGRSSLLDGARPFAALADGSTDGAVLGRTWGTYLHGLFHNQAFRASWLAELGLPDRPPAAVDPYDRLAGVLAQSLDLALVHRIAGLA